MLQAGVGIELIDDCVFSARSAPESGHVSLDRVPGAALLGAAAGKLYASLDRREAFTAFHSGRLRFSDALPWDGKAVAYPVPLCWHSDKNLAPDKAGRLQAERIHNFIFSPGIASSGREVQPKQLRAGYVHADGRWIRPAHGLRLKTAIDPATGRVAEGQLFGYDALARGQRFAARLEADADFDPDLFEQVRAALTGEVLLGRSRSAEYGRAHIEQVVLPATEVGTPASDDLLILWLLSDAALCDASGYPVVQPDADALGLPGAEVDWSKSFLRTRRYSPWNAARHGYDCERLVLAAGSVLTLRLCEPLTPDDLDLFKSGIGLYREMGLGKVWVNPPLLGGKHPPFVESGEEPIPPILSRPQHPLVDWLERQQGGAWKIAAAEEVERLQREYREFLEAARRFAGVSPGVPFGPSGAQWGNVLEAARNAGGEDLYAALFGRDRGIIKPRGEGWSEEAVDESGFVTISQWLEHRLQPQRFEARAYAWIVRELAHRVRNDLERPRGDSR